MERDFGGIGYHYAVDPFGQAWQARGPLPPELPERVRNGAHAQGFNDNSIGIVLIGDFEKRPPTTEAHLALEQAGGVPGLAVRHRPARHRPRPVHRRSGDPLRRGATGRAVPRDLRPPRTPTPGAGTACPGEQLYVRLPRLRDGVVRRLNSAAA